MRINRYRKLIIVIVLIISLLVVGTVYFTPPKQDNVFDEIFYRRYNGINFGHLYNHYEVYSFDEEDGIGEYGMFLKLSAIREDPDDGYKLTVDWRKDKTIRLYTSIQNQEDMCVDYDYDYAVKSKVLRSVVYMYVPKGCVKADVDQRLTEMKEQAKERIDDLINSTLLYNEEISKFSPEDWGIYQMSDEEIHWVEREK